jgi:protein ImuA
MAVLQDQIARVERNRVDAAVPVLSIAPQIDAALPAGGLGLGALHDILAPSEAAMASAMGFCTLLLARTTGTVIWIEAEPDAYAPGLVKFGLEPSRLLFVPAPQVTDALWAMEESLRTPGVGGVFLLLRRRGLDLTAARRLQLAAEADGGIGLVLRLAEVGRSVAQTRWRISPLPSAAGETCWQIDLEHSRHGRPQSWQMCWDKHAHQLQGLSLEGNAIGC